MPLGPGQVAIVVVVVVGVAVRGAVKSPAVDWKRRIGCAAYCGVRQLAKDWVQEVADACAVMRCILC